jgi:predicted  nucleic acid-binding Zn-ribbon protein
MKRGGNMDLTHEQRLTSVEERAKSNSHRLDEIEKRQDKLDDLVSAVNVLAVREQNVENDVKEIKSDVKSLTNKPVQRWESVVDKVIMTIIGIVIGFIFTQIGM